jgi:hypothetical protein
METNERDKGGINIPFLKVSELQALQLDDIRKRESLHTNEEALSFLVTEYREKYQLGEGGLTLTFPNEVVKCF